MKHLTGHQFLKMKTVYLIIALVSSYCAQAQLPENGSLENWQQSQSNLYSEPTGTFWVSLNALADLGGPVTVEKTTDACEGSFAAKLTTKNFTSLIVSGLLASGDFDQNNLADPLKIGKPFTLKPTSFSGCYKYLPANNDSAAMVSILTKWNTQTATRDTIAVAGGVIYAAQSQYVDFNNLYEYESEETPDSIQVIFSSSAGGNSNVGELGSTLYIDNVMVNITNSIGLNYMAENELKVYPNPAADKLVLDLNHLADDAVLTLYDSKGTLISSQLVSKGLKTVDLTALPAGLCIYSVKEKHKSAISGTFIHN